MTAPVWMAAPPEMHSALLSIGPGAGPSLVAAQGWRLLSVEYAEAAEEIHQLVASTRGLWDGTAGESFAAAHAPYLAWLLQTSAESAVTAEQLDIAAASYTAAVATMPTLAELAANHATHAALSATNFFGINTIPIAVNEADYARMWIQAATTMSIYQATSAAALASTPHIAPAPAIVKAGASYSDPPQFNNPLQGILDQLEPFLKSLGITDSQVAHDPMISNQLTTFVAQILHNFGADWNPGAGTLNGQVYDYYADASQPIWYLARSLELFEDILNISQNPGQAIQALQYIAALTLFDFPTHIAQLATTISQSPALLLAAAGAVLAPASAGGLSGLAGLAALPQPLPTAPIAPITAAPSTLPTVTVNAVFTASPSTPTPTTPAPTPSATTAPPPPPSPPTTGASGFTVPYAIGPPDIGFGTGSTMHTSAADKRRTPQSDQAAASTPAQTTSPQRRRTRRRQHQNLHEHGHEFITVTAEQRADPTEASSRSAGSIGFAGTGRAAATPAAGLTTHTDSNFDLTASMPVLPSSWQPDLNNRDRSAGR